MELIDRDEATIVACGACNRMFAEEPCWDADCLIIMEIAKCNPIDAVPVVRCKDCINWEQFKYLTEEGEPVGGCHYMNFMTAPDGFCCFGERKDNG